MPKQTMNKINKKLFYWSNISFIVMSSSLVRCCISMGGRVFFYIDIPGVGGGDRKSWYVVGCFLSYDSVVLCVFGHCIIIIVGDIDSGIEDGNSVDAMEDLNPWSTIWWCNCWQDCNLNLSDRYRYHSYQTGGRFWIDLLDTYKVRTYINVYGLFWG